MIIRLVLPKEGSVLQYEGLISLDFFIQKFITGTFIIVSIQIIIWSRNELRLDTLFVVLIKLRYLL